MSASSNKREELPQSVADRNEFGDADDLVEKDEQMRRMELKIEELQKTLKLAKEKLEAFGYNGNLEEEAMRSQEEETDGYSVLLEYLPKIQDVSHIILEHLVAGEGGAQAILNLRKVNSATKEWVETLPTKQLDWIFQRIPIKFSLSLRDLRKFNETPPPPYATAMIFDIGDEWIPFLHSPGMESTVLRHKSTYPRFYSFWRDQMKTLHCPKNDKIAHWENFDNGCRYFGSPKTLKHLDCYRISNVRPVLSQLDTLMLHETQFFNDYVDEQLALYKRLASNRNLRQLRVQISNKYELNWLGGPAQPNRNRLDPNRNRLQGIQHLIDTRKNDRNFEAVLELDWFHLKGRLTNDQLRSFIESIAASSSYIRITVWDLSLIEKTRTMFLQSPKLPVLQTGLEFFRCFQCVDFKDEPDHEVVNILEKNWLPNLEHINIECHKEEDIQILNNLPSSLKHLKISDWLVFPLAMRNWPEMLTFLEIQQYESRSWTPEEIVTFLESISQNCPLLNELRTIGLGIVEESIVKWKPSEQNTPQYSFKNLKAFLGEFRFMEHELEEQRLEETAITFDKLATRNLLLGIFQVQRMPLLTLTLGAFYDGDMIAIDSECVTTLLNSPVAKSLVTAHLDDFIDEDATESLEQFRSVVQKNRLKREEKFGRQGRRLEYFDFTNLSFACSSSTDIIFH